MAYFNIVAQSSESTVVTEYNPQAKRSEAYQSEADLERGFIRLLKELGYTRYCQGTKLNTQDTLKSISKEIGFFYFDLKSELSRQRLKFKSKDGN